MRDAKASSAGSTSGGGASLGSIRRGALAGRASSSSADGSGAPSRRGARLALALVLALAGLLAFTVAPAFAIPQVFSTTIGSSGSGAGQLSLTTSDGANRPAGDVAVDQSTGDVYVADTGNRRVVKFDSAGNFILAFGDNVDATNPGTGFDVCTAASGDTCQAGTSGTGGGAFFTPEYVAVDNSNGPSAGDVYVGDTGDIPGTDTDIVSKFTPGGAHIAGADIDGSTSGFETFGGPGVPLGIMGIAVDPDGKLWVYNGYLFEFGQSGTFIQYWHDSIGGGANQRGIAADRDHVYAVLSGGRIARYNTSGFLEGIVTRGVPGFSDGNSPNQGRRVAVDPGTGELYITRIDSQIARYNASCTPAIPESIPFPQGAGCSPSDLFGSANLTDPLGLTIDTSSSTLYVADAGTDQIKVFVAPPSGPPVISNQWTSSVASTDATVNTAINPMRNDTTCQLSYTDDVTFQAQGYTGATTVSCDPADLGSRFADHPAEASLAGLAPGTTYHYRFLAHSSAGDVSGADRTFSTEIPELNLPDNRAYEQVSPPNKDLGGITTSNYRAASDGNRMTFFTQNSLPGSASDGRFYNSVRGPAGWSTINQIPPQSQGWIFCIVYPGIQGNTADLSQSILADGFPGTNPSRPCGKDDPELVPGEPDGVQNLFLRDNATGAYQLVSLNPVTGAAANAVFQGADPGLTHVVFDEAAQLTADAPAGADNLYEYSGGAVKLISVDHSGAPLAGGGNLGSGLSEDHAVSDAGSKIFFQGGDGSLYARVNGTSTVQLDGSQGAGPGGGGQFQFASADGSKAFFTDDASAGLTSDTQPGSGTNLYRYDFATGDLTDLTPAATVDFLGFVGGGDSGADLYFAAGADLATGATAGQPNLYSWHDGALAFIATLSSDAPNNFVWNSNRTARVSADGSHLAFNSDQSLGGVDTGGQTEVYLYDRVTEQLTCASCPATGAQPSSNAVLTPSVLMGPATGGSTAALPRNLNADGSRLFFTANGPLVGRDTNGRQDVYEYSGGRPHLISSGTAVKGASFLDASASGDDVFFATDQKLTSSDIDSSRDIYDARVGGGFPEPPPPGGACEGDACRGAGTGPSNVPGPGSGAFQGPGNQTPQHHHKKKHHKKHHHKRHAKHNRRTGK